MIEFSFLGSPQVVLDGQSVTAKLGRKELALLAYLTVKGDWILRDKSASMFWAQKLDSKAKQNLRQACSHINYLLSHVIEVNGRQAIALSQSTYQNADVCQFLDALKNQNFEHAVDLYRGPFLDGLNLKQENAFEEWLVKQRHHFERLALVAFTALMEVADARRDNDALEQYARRTLVIDPFEEKAYQYLMLALGRKGDFNAALQVYRRCTEVLNNELGIPPTTETMAVHERILSARLARHPQLPFHASTFVGRERELAEAMGQLLDPACRLLTLLGPSGVGKTRLAIEMARRTRQQFLHDVCYISLETVGRTVTEDDLLKIIAGGLSLNPSREPLRHRLIDYLRSREMLLVLDNFDLFTPVSGVLNPISRDATDVKILVTSRERLNTREEAIYLVGEIL